MKPLSAAAAKVLDALVDGLVPNDQPEARARRVGEPDGAYMQVVVERLDSMTYSVAHYYTQNGDAMRDPEMVFVRAAGGWYATYFRQDNMGIEQTSAEYDHKSGGFLCRDRWQRQHATFANTWMRNIRSQQAAYFKAYAAEQRARAKAALASQTPERQP